MIRPTRFVLDFYKKYSDCNIIINTITPIISVPLVPVIAIVTLDVQDLDHILQSSSDEIRLNLFYVISRRFAVLFVLDTI